MVTVVIPCLDEEATIAACLRSVQAQTYPRDRLEVLIADGGSRDGTREAIAAVAAEVPALAVQIIDNPERLQAPGCNRAIARARGDVIVRMDAHAHYAADYVERCVEALEQTGADNVGGAQRAAHRTFFQRTLAAALESPLAVGGAAYRHTDREGWVDTVWLGAFRRSVFETVGLFDPRAATNEDAELNLRIAHAGGRVWLSPRIVAYYYPRDSIGALARQYLRYGVGRARTTLKHRRLQTLRPLAPALLVAAYAGLAAATPFAPPVAAGLAALACAHLGGCVVEAARVGARHEFVMVPLLAAIFPVIHLAHGTGFALGLVRYAVSPDWDVEPERLAPRVEAA